MGFERSLTASPGAGSSSLLGSTNTLGVVESAFGLGLEGLVLSPKGEGGNESEDGERTEYHNAHSRVPSEPQEADATITIDLPPTNLVIQATSSTVVPIPINDPVPSRTQSFLSIHKTNPGGGGGKLRKKSAPTTPIARSTRRLNNSSELQAFEAEKEKKRKNLHLPLPSWLVKVKDTKATPHVALDTDTLVFSKGRGRGRSKPGSKTNACTEPCPLTFPPDCEWLFYPSPPDLRFSNSGQTEEGKARTKELRKIDWFGTLLPFEIRVRVLRTLVALHEYDHNRRVDRGGDGWNVVVASRESERWVERVKGMRALVRLSRVRAELSTFIHTQIANGTDWTGFQSMARPLLRWPTLG